MKIKLFKLLHNRPLIYSLVLIVALAWGIAQTSIMYDVNLGMGDNSTFYAFARNIVHGEAMYKDFIHFRTPGTVFMFSIIMRILGQQQSTIEIATRLETLVFYPTLFLISSMILFRKKSPYYVVLAYLGIALLPGITQLRAGFGLLTIVIYIASFQAATRHRLWLFIVGLLTAITFFFGQEIALMVILCLLAGEIFNRPSSEKWAERVKYLLAGTIVGLLPLLIYLLVYSSLKNFLYYTLIYSFIVQPKYMNLPFPHFGYTNLLYFLPFIIYWVCFLVAYTNKKMDFKDGLLLSFGILRLITAVGRSDFGHFIFSIPEVFIIAPYFFLRSRGGDYQRSQLRRFAPYGIALALLLYLATKNGLALAPVPFVILPALKRRPETGQSKTIKTTTSGLNYNVYLFLGTCFTLFVFLLTPTYLSIARSVKQEYFASNVNVYRIGGVKTDEITYKEIKAVQASVNPLHPTTVFAFPIQPFYYSLAEHHASRFITFEAETTVNEQNEAIQDLEHSKPQAVVFDVLQAQGLSGSVWKISDYLTSHYQLRTEVVMREDLWVMVPKAHPSRDDKLVYQLYHDNTEATRQSDTSGIQNTAAGQNAAIQQNIRTIHFSVDATEGAHLQLSMLNSTGTITGPLVCGTVRVLYASAVKMSNTRVCTDGVTSTIPLVRSRQPVTIQFINQTNQPIIWNDPSITS